MLYIWKEYTYIFKKYHIVSLLKTFLWFPFLFRVEAEVCIYNDLQSAIAFVTDPATSQPSLSLYFLFSLSIFL